MHSSRIAPRLAADFPAIAIARGARLALDCDKAVLTALARRAP